MVTHKSSRSGNFSSSKKFDDITYQRDFESGQYAALRGKHSNDCPFRLPDRRAAWQKGFRNATYENTGKTIGSGSKLTNSYINNFRQLLRGEK